MMQIHVDAITASRIAETQYVLSKSLDMVRVSDKRKLLDYLKSGWDIVGKYSNGVGSDEYKTSSESEIERVKYFVEKEQGANINPADTATVVFHDYYNEVTCESEKLIAYVTFSNYSNGQRKNERFCYQDEKAIELRDHVWILGMRQDKSTIITLLEKQLKKESEEQ